MIPGVPPSYLQQADNSHAPEWAVDILTANGSVAVPDLPADECGFVFPRPFTQRAPQEKDLSIETITLSTIGGFKCVQPMGVVRMDFVAVDSATASAL